MRLREMGERRYGDSGTGKRIGLLTVFVFCFFLVSRTNRDEDDDVSDEEDEEEEVCFFLSLFSFLRFLC